MDWHGGDAPGVKPPERRVERLLPAGSGSTRSTIDQSGLRSNGDKAWFGWPKDDKIEELRAQWLVAPTRDQARRANRHARSKPSVCADRQIRHNLRFAAA
jgi:hypothetical protein